MYAAFPQKYRPRQLSELAGQEYIQRTLANAIKANKIAPAYLFAGERGTGKTSTARILAKSLNCTATDKPTTTPCGKCQSCRSIEKGSSLDVAEIDAASHNGVEDARALIERAHFAPAMSRYRIFIVDECLAGDSLVLTNSGLIRIDNPSIVGKSVLSFNELKGSWEFKTVLNWVFKGIKPVYEIRTNNHVLRCTENHPIRTIQGWVKAENLTVGTEIISPKTFNSCKRKPHSACVDVERRGIFQVGKVVENLPLATGKGFSINTGCNLYTNTQSHQWSTNLEAIQSIERVGEELVYDIEVEDNHNFVANGLLVHNCHQLTSQAQNALLKCIEEPPAHVVFILCTTEQHKVLATINSRCQVFHFRVLSIHAIVQQLAMIAQKESIAISQEAKVAIARTAEGGLRDALQLLDQLSLLGEEITSSHVLELSGRISESDLIAILQSIRTGDALKLLQLSRQLIDSGKPPKVLLMSLLACYRDLLLVANVSDSSHLLTSGISHTTLLEIVASWDYCAISAGIEQLRTSEWQLSKSVQPSLWLEVCLLGLVQNDTAKDKGSSKSSSSHKVALPCQPAAIWEKVLSNTSENNRVLLSLASLVELKGKKAVLVVPSPYLEKFNRNAAKVQKMLFGVTGINYQLSIRESHR